nr:reverse transcriptase domain-containing protein [Tanacetum cinerariifolium]
MTLELADWSITRPKGVAEDVFVKMGKFHFLTDFVVVDFEADPRVPLILGRSFLRTGHALIDVYGEELSLRVNNESITFNLNQVMRYSDNYVNRVNVINIACEYVQDNTKCSNPTLVLDSLIFESEFFLEIEDFLNDDSIPTRIENYVYDPEGDILYFENLLKENLFQLPPMNLNQAKSLIEEPKYSLSMGYEHLITTLVTELDEVTESSAKNLVPILSEYEVTSDNESEYEFDFLKAFFRGLMPIHIVDEERIRREHAEYISLMERLITINTCPHPMENSNTIVESLPSTLILVQDNDSQRKEIDIVTNTDELLPPGFENNDSEGEIYVLKELHVDNSIPNSKNELSGNEASDFDDPSFLRPPPEPPDVEFD